MELYVWLPTYPNVMVSLLVELAKPYRGSAHIICPKPVNDADSKRYENSAIREAYSIILVENNEEFRLLAAKILKEHKDAVHFFGGFFGITGRALATYANEFGGKNAYIFTEKPSVLPRKRFNAVNKFVKTVYSHYRYNKAYKNAKGAIKAVFVTGKKGVKQLKSFGLPADILFETMYTHNDAETADIEVKDTVNSPLRLVYVGRFDCLLRGMDTLMEAVKRLKTDNWQLDLVGGYGSDAGRIIDWANSTPKVNYIGEWQSFQVVKNLAEYDVCISPTRVDGWRIQVNQAIMAGIGTITTDEAISDELLEYSNTGVSIKAGSSKQLAAAIDKCVAEPGTVNTWKKNTKEYRKLISNETVGKYMSDVMDYCLNKQGERPECPWIK